MCWRNSFSIFERRRANGRKRLRLSDDDLEPSLDQFWGRHCREYSFRKCDDFEYRNFNAYNLSSFAYWLGIYPDRCFVAPVYCSGPTGDCNCGLFTDLGRERHREHLDREQCLPVINNSELERNGRNDRHCRSDLDSEHVFWRHGVQRLSRNDAGHLFEDFFQCHRYNLLRFDRRIGAGFDLLLCRDGCEFKRSGKRRFQRRVGKSSLKRLAC